jgi:hypothetical protein
LPSVLSQPRSQDRGFFVAEVPCVGADALTPRRIMVYLSAQKHGISVFSRHNG